MEFQQLYGLALQVNCLANTISELETILRKSKLQTDNLPINLRKHVQFYGHLEGLEFNLYHTELKSLQNEIHKINIAEIHRFIQSFLHKTLALACGKMIEKRVYQWISGSGKYFILDTDVVYNNIPFKSSEVYDKHRESTSGSEEESENDNDGDDNVVTPPRIIEERKRRSFEIESFCNVTAKQLEEAMYKYFFESDKTNLATLETWSDSMSYLLKDFLCLRPSQYDIETWPEDECYIHHADHIHISELFAMNGSKFAMIGGCDGILLMDFGTPEEKKTDKSFSTKRQVNLSDDEVEDDEEEEEDLDQKKRKARASEEDDLQPNKKQKMYKEKLYSPTEFPSLLRHLFTDGQGVYWNKPVDIITNLWTQSGHYTSTPIRIRHELATRQKIAKWSQAFRQKIGHHSLFTLDAFQQVFRLFQEPCHEDRARNYCVVYGQRFYV